MDKQALAISPAIEDTTNVRSLFGEGPLADSLYGILEEQLTGLANPDLRGVAVPIVSGVNDRQLLVEERPNSQGLIELATPTETLRQQPEIESSIDGARRCIIEELGAYFAGLCNIQLNELSASLYYKDDHTEYGYAVCVGIARNMPHPNLFWSTEEVKGVKWMDFSELMSAPNLRRPDAHKSVGKLLTCAGIIKPSVRE